jgi:hypothetical protein
MTALRSVSIVYDLTRHEICTRSRGFRRRDMGPDEGRIVLPKLRSSLSKEEYEEMIEENCALILEEYRAVSAPNEMSKALAEAIRVAHNVGLINSALVLNGSRFN